MKSTRSIILCMAALIVPAQAQNWSGPYVGFFAGGAIGSSSLHTTVDPTGNSYFLPASVDSINTNSRVSPSDSSGVAGLTVGFNSEQGDLYGQTLIVGLEADAGAIDLTGLSSKTVTYPCCATDAYRIAQSVHASGLYALRGRFGLADEDRLLYVTGGLAVTHLGLQGRLNDSFGLDEIPASGRENMLNTGWVVGLGTEWRLDEKWSLKADYLHTDFGTASATGTVTLVGSQTAPGTGTATLHHVGSATADILRIGVNYKFSAAISWE